MKKLILIISLIFVTVINLNAGHIIQKFTSAGGGDGWFGYLTEGSSSTTGSATDLICSAMGSPSDTGTVSKIAIYSANTSAGQDIKVGLYLDDAGVPDTIVGTETEFENTGTWALAWKEFTGLSYSVNSANNYWVCWNASVSAQLTNYYDTPAGVNRYTDTVSAYADAWPSTFVSSGSSTAKYSLKAYFTY